jgi:hypothetical protein
MYVCVHMYTQTYIHTRMHTTYFIQKLSKVSELQFIKFSEIMNLEKHWTDNSNNNSTLFLRYFCFV